MQYFAVIDKNGQFMSSTKNKMPALYRSEKAADYFNSLRHFPGRVVAVTIDVLKEQKPSLQS